MREIALHPTSGEAPVTVYDSSGPYTDSSYAAAIEAGLPRLREAWIAGRGDIESYVGRSIQPADNGFVSADRLTPEFPVRSRPLKAKERRSVTQLAYARAGIVTPEMEFVAIRENLGRKAMKPFPSSSIPCWPARRERGCSRMQGSIACDKDFFRFRC